MKVTEDLLKRYHLRNCSPEEVKAVEYWLLLDSDTSLPHHQFSNEASVKQEIWFGIKTVQQQQIVTQRKTPLKIYLMAGSIAACLLIAFFNPYLFSRTITISNQSVAAKEVLLDNISFTLMQNTECQVTLPLLSKSNIQVRLNGAVSIVSNIQSITIDVENSKDCIKLPPGATYLAITDIDQNLISATDKELEDGLPRFFSSRIHERFKIN